MTNSLFSLALAAGALAVGLATGPEGATTVKAPILYTLRFSDAVHHSVDIEARLPNPERRAVEIWMPVWTPGSYLIREYARHLERMSARAEDGSPLAVTKVSKNRWRVEAGGHAGVVITYRLYARDMSVRANFVDETFAMLLGAATFIGVDAAEERAFELRVELPAGWSSAIVPLPEVVGAPAPTFLAESFEQLADTPIYAGSGEVRRFEVAGVPHRIVHQEGQRIWDVERSTADAARIAEAHRGFWQGFPYEQYVIFNILAGDGGGLEHRLSTVLMPNPWQGRTRKDYVDWLSLASHEMFHAWNGKRLRPIELGPFDYEREAYTHSLWVVEGLTSYYDDLLVRRAGLSTRGEYLKLLSKQIERLQETPGRLRQSLSTASFDAWIKFYRPDENSANSSISYYTKGALVGWLLDAEIRRATQGERSLDDAMRLAYGRYSAARGYTQAEFRAVLSEVAGRSLDPQLSRWLDGTDELDFAPALDWFGLRFKTPAKPDDDDPPRVWLGLEHETREGALVVTKVERDAPAYTAGIAVDDEILAFNGYRITPANLAERLKAFAPGDRIEVTVARRQRLQALQLVCGTKPEERWKLEVLPNPSPEQRAHLDAWLGAESAPEPVPEQP